MPTPDNALLQGLYIAPVTATEKALCQIWAKLLTLDATAISATANFFALGGHSLLAMRLVAEIRRTQAQELSVEIIFSVADLRALATKIDGGRNGPLRTAVTAQVRDSHHLPLSFAQQRLWFIDRMEGGSPQYNMPAALMIQGEFNVTAAEQAIGRIIERHEPLRTVFSDKSAQQIVQETVQVICEQVLFKLGYHDLQKLDDPAQTTELNRLIKQDSHQPFDLTADVMLRAAYVHLAANKGVLLFNMHHIASDGWSMGILLNEFTRLYQAESLPALEVQYADYAHWQRQWLVGDVLQQQLDYWGKQLDEVTAVHSLPLDYARPAFKGYAGAQVMGHVPAPLSQQLQTLANQHQVTPFMLLHGALALVLSRHSNTQDMVIGTPMANRMQSQIEPLIGFFVNTLVLRTNSHQATLSDYLAHIKQVNLDAQANQDVPFEQLVEHCHIPRNPGQTPLFQIMFSTNDHTVAELNLPGLAFCVLEGDDITAKFDLEINAQITADGIELRWIYDAALFSQTTVERLNDHLQRLLAGMAEMPQAQLNELPMLSASESDYLLNQLNKTDTDGPQAQLIHQVFETLAAQQPNKPAVVCGTEQLTYQALNEAANRLAHYLMAQGVTNQSLVGLCVERSINMLVGILAILKAGGAYVPLDPDYPQARLQYMLDDTGLTFLLSNNNDLNVTGVEVIKLDDQSFVDYASSNPQINQTADSLAYVIYTDSAGDRAGDSADGLLLGWLYDESLFSEATIRRLNDHLCRLLTAMADTPNALMADLAMLSDIETAKRLDGGYRQADYPANQGIHQLFEQQVQQVPDNIAVSMANQQVSYRELNAAANRLAYQLIDKGCAPGEVVGLYLNRSLPMMVALLAVLKSGAAYLPLDIRHPKDRLQYVIDDAEVHVVLTMVDCRDDLDTITIDTLVLDDCLNDCLDDVNNPVIEGSSPEDLAYILYTSGSTGLPKGVCVEHHQVNHYLSHCQQHYFGYKGFGDKNKALAGAVVSIPLTFDATVTSVLAPLTVGKQVVLLPDSQQAQLDALAGQLLSSEQNWLFKITPTHLQALSVLSRGQKAADNQHVIVLGGEQLTFAGLTLWQQSLLPNALFVNEYGPTETVVGCSVYNVTTVDESASAMASAVPIGKAITNTRLYVLNEAQQLCPDGSVGELYIGGAGVTRGYLNRPELTAERFIDSPFVAGDRLYRTGDLVRYLPNDELEFIGRIDDQVKIRGFRIELGEIEQQLTQCEGVDLALVLVREDTPGEQRLVAYYVPENEEITDDPQRDRLLTTSLQAVLPEYMVPSAFVALAQWPLTTNGKTDRKALPAPDGLLMQGHYIAPTSETEQVVAEIWAKLLHLALENVSVTANFFDLGGHSLLVIRLIAEIRTRLAQELTVKDIFALPTIRDMAALIDQGTHGALRGSISKMQRDSNVLPLSFAQQRLWFIDRMGGGSTQYNMPVGLRIEGAFDVTAAGQALAHIIQRHETLRTVFTEQADGPMQVIRDGTDFVLGEHDLTELTADVQQTQVNALVWDNATKDFDLANDLMLRASYLYLGPQQGILLLCTHHIASDGWSTGILVEEFVGHYQACLKGEAAPFAPLDIQYADFAHWQRQWLSGEVLDHQLAYWSQQLAALPVVHNLPLDYDRPAVKQYKADKVIGQLSPQLSEQLQQLAGAQGVTLFVLLHAALALVLSRHSNSDDIVIGTPVANRMQAELEPLIGFFVNTLVLRTNTDFHQFGDYLQHVRQVNLDAQSYQDVSFEHLVEHCQVPRSTAHGPLFQIVFNMNTTEMSELTLPGVQVSPLGQVTSAARFDIEIIAAQTDDGLVLHWLYDTALVSDLPMLSDQEVAGLYIAATASVQTIIEGERQPNMMTMPSAFMHDIGGFERYVVGSHHQLVPVGVVGQLLKRHRTNNGQRFYTSTA